MDIGVLRQDDFLVWMPFQDAEVLVRYISAEEVEGILRRAKTMRWEKHRKVERLDLAEANRLLGRAAVRGWRGITMDGAEYPYSEEHCDFLMRRWLDFAEFVSTACTDLQALVAEEQKRRSKNSGLTSGQD